MINKLEKFEADQVAKLSEGKTIPEFKAGDTVKVNYRIVEGNKERIQAYQGVCIARKNGGINSSFTVRKISNGEGIERVFPLYSPRIDSIELVRRGVVRRAKLYYMRELSGKAARIKEKLDLSSKAEKGAAKKGQKEAVKAEEKQASKESDSKKADNKAEEKK